MTDDHGPVGVAKDNLCPHIYQLVHKEQAALKHLLMNQDTSLGLGSHYQQHAEQVGGQAGPYRIGQGQDGAVQETLYLILLLPGNEHIVAPLFQLQSQPAEAVGNDSQVLPGHILDGELTVCHGCHADKAAHLYHIRKNAVRGSMQRLHSLYGEQVGSYAGNLCPHLVQHPAKLLDVRLTGCIIDGGLPLGCHGCHHDIGRTGHGSLIEQHIGAFQTVLTLELVPFLLLIVCEGSPQVAHAPEMGIQASAAYLVSSGLSVEHLPQSAEQRAYEHDRAAQLGAFLYKRRALNERRINVRCLEAVAVFTFPGDNNPHIAEQLDKIVHIQYIGDILYNHLFWGEKNGTDDLQCLIFCSLRGDFTVQVMISFYYKRCHILVFSPI